jgi:hypothetical protein
MYATDRVPELEKPGNCVKAFFSATPIQVAGVTVRRTSSEALGGFRRDLVCVNDREMWARIISAEGGIVSNRVSAFYRQYGHNQTSRQAKIGENASDMARLNMIFAARHPKFSLLQGQAEAAEVARRQYVDYRIKGDLEGAAANWDVWRQLASPRQRFLQALREAKRLAMTPPFFSETN